MEVLIFPQGRRPGQLVSPTATTSRLNNSRMKAISNHLLKKLAGPAAFQRGKNYYQEGRVAELRSRGKTITALVEGTETWRVTLKHTATVFEGCCDCPASDNFDFCKHCVAAAMQYRAGLEQEDQLKNPRVKDRLPAYFMTWQKQDLVDLTLELLNNDHSRLTEFRIKADSAAGKMDDKAIKKQITAAIPCNRQLFKYHQVRNYFQTVESVLENLEPLIKSLTPEKALKLIDYAMQRIDRALETIDDSGGFRYHSVELLASLHLDTLGRSALPPEQLAAYLYRLYSEPVSDLYPPIPDHYLAILGAEGQQHFFETIRSEWEILPPLTDTDWDKEYVYRRLMHPLLEEARRSGDTDAQIALHSKIANGFQDYLELSALCLANNQLEQALHWRQRAEKDNKKAYHSKAALQENQIAIWSQTGDYQAVLDARWEQFLGQPSLPRYLAILEVPGARKKDTLKQRALAELEQRQSRASDRSPEKQAALDTQAQIYLHYKQTEDALGLAEKERLDPTLLLRIAKANNQSPDRTLPLFIRVAEFHVNRSDNQSYKEAIEILKCCRQQLPAKSIGRFEARVKALHDEFKRKRNFIKWLEEALPEMF